MKTIYLALLLVACGGTSDDLTASDKPGPTPGDPTPAPTATTPPGSACVAGKTYTGFGGRPLVNREQLDIGVDRGRVKPYSVLATEYQRVLGNTPASLAGAADTFGQPAARWFDEPTLGAVGLQSAYKIAFDGCLTYVEQPGFEAAPTATTAGDKCASMARTFWSRTASPDQISACVDVAVNGAKDEPDVKKRWSYACASVLTSSGFLSY